MAASVSPGAKEHRLFSRAWAFAIDRFEPKLLQEGRTELVAGLRGVVVEIGAGNGVTFAHYPPEVERVIAIEPEPYLRSAAQRAAARAPVPVEVVDALAGAIPLGDGEADAVVCALVLCTVPDQADALAEARRVLRPRGELRYWEHVAEPQGTRARRWQELVERSGLWARGGGGCHVNRETGPAIVAAGFAVEREREVRFGPPGLPMRRHLVGAARR